MPTHYGRSRRLKHAVTPTAPPKKASPLADIDKARTPIYAPDKAVDDILQPTPGRDKMRKKRRPMNPQDTQNDNEM